MKGKADAITRQSIFAVGGIAGAGLVTCVTQMSVVKTPDQHAIFAIGAIQFSHSLVLIGVAALINALVEVWGAMRLRPVCHFFLMSSMFLGFYTVVMTGPALKAAYLGGGASGVLGKAFGLEAVVVFIALAAVAFAYTIKAGLRRRHRTD